MNITDLQIEEPKLNIQDLEEPKLNIQDLEEPKLNIKDLQDITLRGAVPVTTPMKPVEPGFITSVERGLKTTQMGGNALNIKAQDLHSQYLDDVLKGGDPKAAKQKFFPDGEVPLGMDKWSKEAMQKRSAQLKGRVSTDAQRLVDLQAEQDLLPVVPEYEALGKATSLKDFGKQLITSPVQIFKGLIGESIGSGLITLPAPLIGGAVGGIPGATAGVAASSAITDYATGLAEILTEMKVDMKDPEAVVKAIRSAAFTKAAGDKIPRAVVVGTADALGARIGMGKALFKSKTGNIAAKAGVDAVAGMVGEAGGQIVEGKPLNINEILMEGIGGLPGSVKDMTVGKGIDIIKGTGTPKVESEDLTKTKLDTLQREVELEKARQDAVKAAEAVKQAPPITPQDKTALPAAEAPPAVPALPAPVDLGTDPKATTASPPTEHSSYDVGEISSEVRATKTAALEEHINQGGTVRDLATFLATEGPTERYRSIAQRAADVLGFMQDAGHTSEVGTRDTGTSMGTWEGNLESSRIDFSEDGTPTFRTALHEVVHGVTVAAIDAIAENRAYYESKFPDMVKAVDDLKQILQDAKDLMAKTPHDKLPDVLQRTKDGKTNFLDNEKELIAWAMSHSGVQRWLNTLPFKGGKRFISRFVDSLQRMFRIKKEDQSAFKRILGIYDRLTVEDFVNDIYSDLSETKEKSILDMVDRDPFDFTHDTVEESDLHVAQTNSEEYGKIAAEMNGVKNAPLPYASILEKLKALGQDPSSEGQEQSVPVRAMDTKSVMALLGGNFAAVSESPEPTGWAFITRSGHVPALIQLFDNRKLYERINNVYKNVKIMTPFEAEYYLKTGETTREAYLRVEEEDAQREVLKRLGDTKRGQANEAVSNFKDEENVEVAKEKLLGPKGKDLLQNITDYASGGTTTKATMTNNPVIKWLRYAMQKATASQSFLTATRIAPIGNLFQRLSKQERIQVMKGLMLGDKNQIELTPEMMRRSGFSKDQIKLVSLMYDTDKYLYDKWNNARFKVGMPPVPYRQGHFPGRFAQDYQVTASIDGKIVGAITADNMAALQYNIRKMQSRFPTMTTGPVHRNELARTPRGQINLWDAYDEIAKLMGDDPAVKAFMAESMAQSTQTANEMFGFNKHEMAKKGVWGNEGNKPWKNDSQNAEDAFAMWVQYVEQGILHHELLPVMNDLNKLITDPRMRNTRPKTVKYLESYFHHISRRTPTTGEQSKIGRVLHKAGKGSDMIIDAPMEFLGIGPSYYRLGMAFARSVFSTMVMGIGNVAFTALQFSQIPIFAGPMAVHFRAKYGLGVTEGRGSFAVAALGINGYFMKQYAPKLYAKLPAALHGGEEIMMAMKYAKDNNLINFADIDAAIEASMSPTAAKVDFGLNFNQRIAESMTRPYAFLWFFNIARNGGASMHDALTEARNATQFAMVSYRSEERPMMYAALGSLGSALGQLKTFAHSAVAQNVFWLTKAKSPKPLLYSAAMIVAVLGIEAMPGFDLADELVKYFNTKRIGKPDGIREFMMENNEEWLNKGALSWATNVDFQARLRMPQFVNTQSLLGNFPALNYFTEIAKATNAYYEQPWNTQVEHNFAYQITPNTVWLKGKVAEESYSQGSYLTDKKGALKYEMTPRDWLLRKWGIRSVDETRAAERLREGDEDTSFQQKRIKNLETTLTEMGLNNMMGSKEYEAKLQQYLQFGYDENKIIGLINKEFESRVTPALERKIGKGNTVDSARKEQNYDYHK